MSLKLEQPMVKRGANLLDFPITYDDLADYYTKAENKMGTTGTGGRARLPVITTIRYLNMVPENGLQGGSYW